MSDDPTRAVDAGGPPTEVVPTTPRGGPPPGGRPPRGRGPGEGPPWRSWEPWQMAAVAVLVLAVGVLLGAVLLSGDDDESATPVGTVDEEQLDDQPGEDEPADDEQPADQQADEGDAPAVATTTTTQAPAAGGAETGGVDPVPVPAGDTGPQHFSSPSGNIGCYLDDDHARCDIQERAWEPPPAPPECEGDWGQGLVVTDEGAEVVCATDTTLGAEEVLPYGQMARRGQFECRSAESGVTCVHRGSGRGFVISRGSYELI